MIPATSKISPDLQMNTFNLLAYSCLFVLSSMVPLGAITSTSVFEKYRSYGKIFVETGSHVGDGIAKALNAGYEEVHSIELSPELHARCVKRFQNNPRVHLYLGDSAEVLGDIVQGLKEPAVFWLDGHYSGGNTVWVHSWTPVLRELREIRNANFKNHVILIDDIRCCNTEWFDFISLESIIKELKSINPDYLIRFEDGFVPQDVLVGCPSI